MAVFSSELVYRVTVAALSKHLDPKIADFDKAIHRVLSGFMTRETKVLSVISVGLYRPQWLV